eukprot:16305900-Heterocapsa_arctica.AAC.1
MAALLDQSSDRWLQSQLLQHVRGMPMQYRVVNAAVQKHEAKFMQTIRRLMMTEAAWQGLAMSAEGSTVDMA